MSHIPPKQRFKSVPSLPLFLIEKDSYSGQMSFTGSPRSDVGQQSQETGTSCVTRSPSDMNSSLVEVDYHQPPERRSRGKSRSDDRRATIELLAHVHGSTKPRRPSRKPKRKHKPLPEGEEEEITTEMTFGGCVSEEREQDNRSSRRDSVHSSSLRRSLAKEVERLTLANRELTQRLQASEVSQDSGYQHTIPDRTLTKEDSETKLLEQLSQFEHEYRALEKERNHYKNELSVLRKQAATGSGGEGSRARFDSLQSENRELNEDVLMLKNLVYRLNVELERYQERLRAAGGESTPGLRMAEKQDERPEETAKLSRGTLSQLLVAYDETISEKDDLIRNYEKDINSFVGKCKDVVAENERLHRDIVDYKQKAEEATEGYSVLRHEASIAEEQNALLINQLQMQKDKIAEVHSVYRDKVAELTSKNEELLEQSQRGRGDLLTLRGSYSVLRDEYDRQRAAAENTVTLAAHSAAVTECRRLLDELKGRHEAEQGRLAARVREAEEGVAGAGETVAALRDDKARLEAHVGALDKALKKCQEQCQEARGRCVTTKVSKDALKRQLRKAIAFARELVQDQESLLKQLHAKQEETDNMARMSSGLVDRMGTLRSNLQNVQKGAWQELDTIEKRIVQQESGVGRMREEYRRETKRLQNLVEQKEDIIQRLQKEKAQTEESLEVVWKAVAADEARGMQRKSNVAPDDTYSDDKF